MENTLYYGDNLDILHRFIKDESIDLIYLDPPFNSNRSYNVLFKDESGMSDAQITAFDDAWHWGETAEKTYQELIQNAPMNVATMIDALRQFIGRNQMMAYLVMMTARLVELHRVLKRTGSLYLHCDPTASHYLKMILDMIFGVENFRNEIIWKRTFAHNSANKYGSVHDTLLYYQKTNDVIWNKIFVPYENDYVETFFDQIDENGKRYMRMDLTGAGVTAGPSGQPWRGIDVRSKGRHWAYVPEQLEKFDQAGKIHWPQKQGGMPRLKRYPEDFEGLQVQDIWTDIKVLHNLSAERLGYPTQKPLALLERIISASSNPGDIILDPFSGCGTCISAAQKLDRKWIGIDITHLAIAAHKARLKDNYGLEPKKDYQVVGEPEDLAGANQLARDDRFQFQWWALSLINARPLGGSEGSREGKKGADRGIDGAISFVDGRDGGLKRAIVQVKSGHVNSGYIRDLKGTLEREKAEIGIFITLEPFTREMTTEATSAGFYHSEIWNKDYPRIQIVTIENLLNGAEVKVPPTPDNATAFKKAEKVTKQGAKQGELDL